MPRILDRDEVDVLLRLVREDGGPARPNAGGPEGAPARDVEVLDFRRPRRVPQDAVAAVAALHEEFARGASAALSDWLRAAVDVRLVAAEASTYGEFTLSAPAPTVLATLACKPLAGPLALEIEPAIVFPCIDKLLGGGARPCALRRPFTLIERGLIDSLVSRLVEPLRRAWEPAQPLAIRVREVETQPALSRTLPPDEPVILLAFEACMGESRGLVKLCVPYGLVAPIADRLPGRAAAGEAAPSVAWPATPGSSSAPSSACAARSADASATILENIGGCDVEVAGILAEIDVRLIDVLDLQAGDIFEIGLPRDGELRLAVGAERPRSLFRARAGEHRGRLALCITGIDDSCRDPAAGGAGVGTRVDPRNEIGAPRAPGPREPWRP